MFATPLGFLALLSVPAILALHLFRRKFRPHVVSALFLWSDESATPISGRKRERLPKSLSLACELLSAICLSLCLAGPRGCAGDGGEHLVVVVDGSASMGAGVMNGVSVVDSARTLIEQRIDRLASGSSVTLIQSGARAKVIAGPAAFPVEARSALARFEPTALHHDLIPALELARQIANGGRVVCVTDRLEGADFGADVEVVALGSPSDNVAIVRANRSSRFGASVEKDTVELVIANFGRSERDTHIEAVLPLENDRAVLTPVSLRLGPSERKTTKFDVPRSTGPIEVRLGTDALAIDDKAWLAPPPRRTVRLRAHLADDNARFLGLASKDRGPIGRWLALVDDVTESDTDELAHVLVTDAGGGGPTTWTIALATLGAERKDFIGPFLTDKRHPLLEGVTLEGLVWGTDPKLELGGAPLVSAGNQALLTEERLPGRRAYSLALDPARSSFQRSLDWPIVLVNVVEMRRSELPGPSATNIQVDDEITWRAGDVTDAPLKLVGPGTEREVAPRSVLTLASFESPGLYTLTRAGTTLATFGVNFSDAAESDLSERSSGERASTLVAADARPTTSNVTLVLLALAAALLLLDWWVLGRSSARFGPERSGSRAPLGDRGGAALPRSETPLRAGSTEASTSA